MKPLKLQLVGFFLVLNGVLLNAQTDTAIDPLSRFDRYYTVSAGLTAYTNWTFNGDLVYDDRTYSFTDPGRYAASPDIAFTYGHRVYSFSNGKKDTSHLTINTGLSFRYLSARIEDDSEQRFRFWEGRLSVPMTIGCRFPLDNALQQHWHSSAELRLGLVYNSTYTTALVEEGRGFATSDFETRRTRPYIRPQTDRNSALG